MDDLMRND
jgi:hypothetical protein